MIVRVRSASHGVQIESVEDCTVHGSPTLCVCVCVCVCVCAWVLIHVCHVHMPNLTNLRHCLTDFLHCCFCRLFFLTHAR